MARCTLLTLALGALGGCRLLLDVHLASVDERLPSPRFTVSSTAGAGEPPRYVHFELLEESGKTMWRVRAFAVGDWARPGELTYGIAPDGFETAEGPLPLEEGHVYTLFFTSMHPTDGRLRFRVEPGGAVREQQ